MEILDRINTEFGGKYNFLRVQSVTYSTHSFSAQIIFLYPESCQNFDDTQKLEISDFVKKELSLGCEVKIKFKKSYLDENLIKKNCLNKKRLKGIQYLCQNFFADKK